jgi:hypothetical protein
MGRVVRLIRRTTNIGFSFSPRWPWFQWDVWHDEWEAKDDVTTRGICVSISRPVAAPPPSARRTHPAQPSPRAARSQAPSSVAQYWNDRRRASLTMELASELDTFVRHLNAADIRRPAENLDQNAPAPSAPQKTKPVDEAKTSNRKSGAPAGAKKPRAKRRQTEEEFNP